MQLTFCGANHEVTGSRHLLEVNGKKILLDCGMAQGHRKDADAKNRGFAFDPAELDAVVISHAHIDHCGNLPVLLRYGFRGAVYGTPATMDILPYMLRDSGHIQEQDALTWNRHHKQKEWIQPLYTVIEAESMDRFYRTIDYDTPTEIVPGVTITLKDAGHILGSAIVVADCVEGDRKKRVVYSGDLGRKLLPILRDPQPFEQADVLLLESTYGDRKHEPYEDVRTKLADVIRRTAERGGKVLIPAFALERTQEIVYLLHELHDAGEIPALPIIVDSPLAANLIGVFKKHLELFDEETQKVFLSKNHNPFTFDNFRVTVSTEESKALMAMNGPAIIISASGMCESGRILHHLRNFGTDHRTTILIVGYMAEHTLGRRIQDGQRLVKIYGDEVTLRAEVVTLGAFSAHADYEEELTYLDNQPIRDAIYLVHGESDAMEALKMRLETAKLAPRIETPEFRATFPL